jgi:hypothetical protein
MEQIVRILALAGVAISFVVLRDICRSRVAQGYIPPVWIGFVHSAGASLLMLLTFYSTDIFGLRFWGDDHLPGAALIGLLLFFVIFLVLSLAVVMSFRK